MSERERRTEKILTVAERCETVEKAEAQGFGFPYICQGLLVIPITTPRIIVVFN